MSKQLEVVEASYPTTVIPPEQQRYIPGKNCKSIKIDSRNGEMARVPIIVIEHEDGTFTQIDMSACVVDYREQPQ